MTDHPILFIPGPVEVDEELRQIMAMPLLGHRDPAVKELSIRLASKLKQLYRTEQHAFFENAPATALMEASIRNVVSRRSLHFASGAFGSRWIKVSKACGKQPSAIELPMGAAITPELVEETLKSLAAEGGDPIEAVCFTHNETSTGVLNPLAECAAVVRRELPDALILVDAVTSVGGAPLEFDAWGLDVAFAGTQKCLALPPGLVTYAVSERAIEKAATIDDRGFLLDFTLGPGRFAKGAPPATPNVPLLFALERQLDRIAEEGLENRWARHQAMRDETVSWAQKHGFEPFVAEAFRSTTVSTLRAEGDALNGIIARAKQAGFTLGKGYGDLKEQTFRVGHMGDHTLERLRALLTAIEPVAV
ncbi:MAG: alanine--glyoxylate aminotransferase family protein [Planctomycetota bacterium]